MSKFKDRVNIVYSTNPDFKYETEEEIEKDTLPAGRQHLKVSLDKKARAGKQVTIVSGFEGKFSDLEKLTKELKGLCGSGGSCKDGEILIQGDQRNKIFEYLIKKGYQARKIG